MLGFRLKTHRIRSGAGHKTTYSGPLLSETQLVELKKIFPSRMLIDRPKPMQDSRF